MDGWRRDDERAPLLGDAAVPDPVDSKTPANARNTVTIGETVINGGIYSGSGNHPVCSSWMYFSVAACVIGTSFSFGFALGCLNTPTKVMQEVYMDWYSNSTGGEQMSSSELTFLWGATVSIYCLGGVLSGCAGGAIADTFGRKRTMMAANLVQVTALVLMFSSIWIHRYEIIIGGRFVYGLYGGLATVVCPLYLDEISPQAMRGKVGTINQLMIVIAMAIAQVLGLPQLLGTADHFYYILALPIVPAVIHWIMLAASPESPSWLYLKANDRDAARQALEKLRDLNVMSSVDGEIEEYHQAELAAASEPKVTLKDMFTTYRHRPLLVVVTMHISQQLGGINAVLLYSTIIFGDAGLSHDEAQYATISLGSINLIMTLVSLALIERLGRRTLHLHGLGGGFLSLALLSAFLILQGIPGQEWMSYLCIVFTATYIIFFAVGPAPIPWFYTAELFDLASRKWAISIAIAVNWTCNFAVGISFPFIQAAMQNYAFMPFMFIIACCWTYLYMRAPETKGRSTVEITNRFKTIHSIASLPADERKHYRTFATT